ncbi:YfhO family protein [Collinsella stercoris]|uniref:YfhO family protein n=1 Tax=Collinsella stercoris TaxID=147206 RepID=UPI0026EB4700|nr:YfhO family protein [Collinsella stercoris]
MSPERPQRARSALFWVACAALPVLLLLALSAWGGIYPLGPESFLTEDLKYQYIDFFTWFRHVLTGEANIFYSFAQGMGSNTWGLYSYYLASPFNFIILLFDEAHLTLAIYVIVALKLVCMNTAMAWYLRRRFTLQRTWALALALCYTWSTWTATNLRNPLWLDALILLPLMAWSCRQLLRTGRFIGLSLLVAADVITCWYMAYITLLFCCLFVLFELAVMIYDDEVRPARSWIAGRAVRFTVAILLGLGLSAWTFVPTVLAMMGGGAKTAVGMFQTYPTALIRGFLPFAWNIDHAPQFYTGLIPLVLAISMLFEKRIDKRLRALTLVFAGFLVVSSVLGPLMYVWCGFRQPNGFYCRIAFLLSFLEIWAAAFLLMRRAACRAEGSNTRTVSWTEAGGRSACAAPIARKLAPFGTLVLVLADLGFNAHVCWNQLYINYPQDTHDTYVNDADTQVRELKQLDADAFYRVDKTYNRAGAAFNEGISHGFNQLSTYSSANNPQAVAFLNSLGYSSEGEFSSVYAAPNLVMDSLLGVRYIGTWSKPVASTETTLPHSNVTSPVYYNPHALSLGYPCANGTNSESTLQGDDPFERQNALFAELTGIDRPLYTQLQGVEQARSDASITWAVKLPAHTIGYTYAQTGVESDWSQSVGLIVGGEMISSEATRFSHNVRAFGESGDESTQHEISMVQGSPETQLPPKSQCLFYALNIDVFEEGIERLQSRQFTPDVFEDGHVEGVYNAEKQTDLVLSIPYDKGWSAIIDGKEVALSPAFGGGMSQIQVPEGSHRIEMRFQSPGFTVGCAASIAALAACLVVARVQKRGGQTR